MTNKEAATIVERIRYYMEGGECWTDAEFIAMDMAIEALTAQPDDDDTISRQAAIDAAIKATDDWDGGYNITRANMIEKELNELPSAQPVLTCKGCKYDYYECVQCLNCLRKERDLYEPEG